MKLRVFGATVAVACAACGGKVDLGYTESGTGGTAANGGAGGGAGTNTGGSGDIPGTGGTGVVEPGTGLCPLGIIGGDTFEPSTAAARYDGPIVVPTPAGFVLGYWRGSMNGDVGTVRLHVNDDGIKLEETAEEASPCPGGARSTGLGAAWNEALGAGLMAVSTEACSPSDSPKIHLSNFHDTGASIAEMEYELPGEVVLEAVKSAAAEPGSNRFLLAGTTAGSPLLYTVDGVAVQADPPPSMINPGFGTASFAQIASEGATLARLTNDTEGGGKLVTTIERIGTGVVTALATPSGRATSLATWGSRAAVVWSSPLTVEWALFDEAGNEEGGSFATDSVEAVDVVKWDDELVLVGGQAGLVSVFRVHSVEASPAGATQAMLSTQLDGYEGTRVAVAAARDRVVVAWINSTEELPAGSSPGGYMVMGCVTVP